MLGMYLVGSVLTCWFPMVNQCLMGQSSRITAPIADDCVLCTYPSTRSHINFGTCLHVVSHAPSSRSHINFGTCLHVVSHAPSYRWTSDTITGLFACSWYDVTVVRVYRSLEAIFQPIIGHNIQLPIWEMVSNGYFGPQISLDWLVRFWPQNRNQPNQ